MDKKKLVTELKRRIAEKIKHWELLIDQARESNNETKSSMGDKYETSREMVQQEINNLQIQLNEHIKSQNSLKLIGVNPHQVIGLGSLIQTDQGLFYIAVSLGEIIFDKKKIFVISVESPLAKALIGKKKGEKISLNNMTQTVQDIW